MSRVSLTFLWETPARAIPVFSVFIPFFGCPRRCVFCSQHDQTGQQASPLDEILARAAADLHARRAQGRPPVELAFYGGTFTALAPRDLDACLDMADSLRRDGCITRFRCSTRPDRLDAALLARLRRHGCRTVELGIQSFSDTALQASERHYSGRQATEACRLVRDAGLAPEPGMEAALLAGPADRNLGGRVLGRALWLHVCACLLRTRGDDAARSEVRAAALLDALLAGGEAPAGLPRAQALYLPRSCQGFFRGPGDELGTAWAALGITRRNLVWTAGQAASLHLDA